MNNPLNDFLHYRALAAKYDNEQAFAGLLDQITPAQEPKVRQIATVMAVDTIQELDDLLAVLKMSKRQFIEQAILAAMDEAHHILELHGVQQYHDVQAAYALGGEK